MTDRGKVTADQDSKVARDAQRYVFGRMTEEEAQRFEISMLEQPEIAIHVQLTRQIRAGLQRLAERGDLGRLSVARPRVKSWRVLASAAVAVLAIGTGLLLYLRQPESMHSVIGGSPTKLGYANGRTETTASYILAHTRGRPDVLRIRITGPGLIEIQVVPDLLDSSGKYRVTLQRKAGDQLITIGSASGLILDANGSIPMYITPTELVGGQYTLILKGQTTAEEKFSLLFER